MAATYTKPTKAMHWADTSGNITEPLEAKKNQGWLVDEIPPSSYENWLKNNIGTWLEWIDERLFDGVDKDEFRIKSPGDGSNAIDITNSSIQIYKSLIPTTDNSYDLGNGTYKWRNLYVDGIAYIDILNLSAVAGEGVQSDLIPGYDDIYNLGNISYKWNDLWIDGTANIDILVLSITAGEGVNSNLLPTIDNTYDLGSPSYEWRNLHVDGNAFLDTLYLSTIAGEGSNASIVPTSNGIYNLGSTSYKWQTGYFSSSIITSAIIPNTSNIIFQGNAIPSSDDTYDLGSSSYEWQDLWLDGTARIDTLSLSTSAGEGINSNTIPALTTTWNLGSPSYEWQNLYIGGTAYIDILDLSESVSEGIACNVLPTADNTYDLGASGREFKDLWLDGIARIDTLSLSTSAGEGVSTSIIPTVSDSVGVGSPAYYWASMYADTYYGKTTTVQSFDTYDDLKLAISYKPSGKYIEKIKNRENRKIELGDSSSLPWPMLDETGKFLDYNTSLVFLLGCIKQLNEKVESMRN